MCESLVCSQRNAVDLDDEENTNHPLLRPWQPLASLYSNPTLPAAPAGTQGVPQDVQPYALPQHQQSPPPSPLLLPVLAQQTPPAQTQQQAAAGGGTGPCSCGLPWQVH